MEGDNKKKELHKKIKPWAQKWLRSGHPWDGHKTGPASKEYQENYDKIDWHKEKKETV